MIDEKTKSIAISRIKHLEELEAISEDMLIPLPLLREWESQLDPNDIIAVNSNVYAIEKVLSGELIEGKELILKQKLEDAAIEIAKRAGDAAGSGDVIYAKSLDLCANAVSKLYSTMINKIVGEGGGSFNPSSGQLTLFQKSMKD